MEKKEAMKILKDFHDKSALFSVRTALDTIIPELRESGDEKIREAIHIYLDWLGGCRDYQPKGDYTIKDMITWLNKQDEIDFEHYKDGENEKRKFVGYGFLKCKGDFLSFKEGETYWLEYIGKDNYNVRSDNLLGQTFYIKPVELYTVFCPTTWLEKQGKKPQGKTALEAIKEEEVDNQNCVKPTEKVEPKFKIGDWVIWDNKISCHIDNIYQGKESLMYTITDTNNMTRSYSVKGFDNNAHLWTIQNAKDGDVLKEDSCIFIIQKLGDNNTAAKTYCILYDDGDFDDGAILYFDIDSTKPATKEQRDTLFKAMADAGYTFDFEKKELKKIEQPELTEFEDAVKDLMDTYRDAIGDRDATIEEVKKHAAYMLSLIPPKPTVGWRPAWSEEDEHRVKDTIYFLDTAKKHYASVIELDACIDWLKSLKDRVGCEANCTTKWKPSEEQMKALAEALSLAKNCGEERAFDLRTLYRLWKHHRRSILQINGGISYEGKTYQKVKKTYRHI